MDRWYRHFYQPGIPLGKDGRRVTCSAEHIALSRRAAAEGAVLLKNEGNMLPINRPIAVFGKGIADYVKGGGGSGDVTVPYMHSLLDGLKQKKAEGLIDFDEDLADYYQSYVDAEYAAGSS